MSAPEITTPRLRLRSWRDSDLEPWTKLCTDPRVMRYLSAQTPEQIGRLAALGRFQMAVNPYGGWAVEAPGVADLIGAVGLQFHGFESDFTPCMEVGWRLAYEFWGKGYATEAASAVLAYAFERLHLDEIVSMSHVENKRSFALMERIGLRYVSDIQWPLLPEGDPLRPYALYRLRREDWSARRALAGSLRWSRFTA